MPSNTFLVLLILSGVCLLLTQASYEDCCLKYVKGLKPTFRKHAIAYRLQKIDGGCNIPAVIFTMKRGRRFCTNPSEKWVKEMMNKIDRRPVKNDKSKVSQNHPQHLKKGSKQPAP